MVVGLYCGVFYEACNPITIFAGLSKLLDVFLLGTQNIMWGGGGGKRVGILVVVCGKICGCVKICGKIEILSDWNKNWCGSRY